MQSLADLVVDRPGDFRVHTDAYVSPAIFELEMRRIFERTWVYVAHESQLPAAGDYITTTIGTQPVIVTRDTPRRRARLAESMPTSRVDRLPARVR